MVEHSTADREVLGSNPGAPYFGIFLNFSSYLETQQEHLPSDSNEHCLYLNDSEFQLDKNKKTINFLFKYLSFKIENKELSD